MLEKLISLTLAPSPNVTGPFVAAQTLPTTEVCSGVDTHNNLCFQGLRDVGSSTLTAAEGVDAVGDYSIGPSYVTDPVFISPPAIRSFYTFNLPMNLAQGGSQYFNCEAPEGSPGAVGYPSEPGFRSTHNFWCRDDVARKQIKVYIPSQYQDGDEAAMMVAHDGSWHANRIAQTMEARINHADPAQRLPVFILIAIATGSSSGTGKYREYQYLAMSSKHAEFIENEVLPAVLSNTQIAADYPNLRITSDPDGRASFGCSSAGATSISLGWFGNYSRIFALAPAVGFWQWSNDGGNLPQNPENLPNFQYHGWQFHSTPEQLRTYMQTYAGYLPGTWGLYNGRCDATPGGCPALFRDSDMKQLRMAARLELARRLVRSR